MFVLSRPSPAYGGSPPQLIKSDVGEMTIAQACKKILMTRENGKYEEKPASRRQEYFLFDIVNVVMTFEEDRIIFEFLKDDIKTPKAFSKYIKENLGRNNKIIYLTYSEFANHICKLKEFLVEQDGITDDPFVSYDWVLEKIDIPEGAKYLYYYENHCEDKYEKYHSLNPPKADNDLEEIEYDDDEYVMKYKISNLEMY